MRPGTLDVFRFRTCATNMSTTRLAVPGNATVATRATMSTRASHRLTILSPQRRKRLREDSPAPPGIAIRYIQASIVNQTLPCAKSAVLSQTLSIIYHRNYKSARSTYICRLYLAIPTYLPTTNLSTYILSSYKLYNKNITHSVQGKSVERICQRTKPITFQV